MKNTHTAVPEIIEHLNPVTEQFGPVSHDSRQMQIPTTEDIIGYTNKLLTKTEQAICDIATD